MRPAALTASLLLHTGLLAAVCAWRAGAPAASLHPGDGEPAPDFAFLAESGSAAPAAAEEVVAVVEFTPPPEPTTVPVEAVVDPVATAVTAAIAATPTALASAVPAAAKTAQRSPSRRMGSLSRGAGSGSGSGGGAGYLPPRYRVCPAPPYPTAARARKLEGAALLLVLVDDAGRPTQVTLRRTTGSTLLDEAALRAVWSWRFEPARAGGRAIAASVEVPVRFRYRG